MIYEIVKSGKHFDRVLSVVGGNLAALDFETTAFVPEEGRVRLAQIYNDAGWWVIDFDQIDGGFKAVAHLFSEAQWIVFNAGFEQRWIMAATDEPVTCYDVALLRRAIEGGGHFSLAKALLWDLDHHMPKDEQASDWGAEVLTKSQLDYAADDALWTWRLWQHWRGQADDGHMRAFNMLNDMIPAVIEMEEHGLTLEPRRHQKLIEQWEELAADRVKQIREMIGEDEVPNLNSGHQLSDFFCSILPDEHIDQWPKTDKTGLLSTANSDLKMIGAALCPGTPLQDALTLLSEYKTLTKYISSFGDTLITKAKQGKGRVHARYNIAAARTGRFSSSGPNLQQIPRDRDFFGERLSVRQSFVAGRGRRLVSLDYSGIELRVLALLSGDEQLLHDMIDGDVHLEMGSYMAGRRLDKKITADKEIRQSAKAVSFGIVYGISSLGLSATLKSSMDRAQELIDYWASRYPKAFALRDEAMRDAAAHGGYLRVVDGGTIWMGKPDKISPTQCANYPVQRAALSVMANAIIHHHDSLLDYRQGGGDAWMASTIHDALIDETAERDAEPVLKLMKRDMVAGYLDVFPDAPTDRLVEGGIGPNWGELEDVEV
jgi:DNA polymerase-1